MNVKGFCEAIMHLINMPCDYGIYNIGTRYPLYSMDFLAHKIKDIAKSKSEIRIIPPPTIRTQFKQPVLDKLEDTGYIYHYDFDQDLEYLIKTAIDSKG
jgi:nucleoside-diphosphate-sugar epimerase